MLDAAAAGNVFTSPVPDQMEAATRAVDGGAGVLHIVKNYTGDVLNFQMAAELVAGEIEVAIGRDQRRRGGPGLALHGRPARRRRDGAAREDRRRPRGGRRLARRRRRDGDQGQRQGRSMGLALTSCIVPAAGTPTFELADDEVEVGIGIHGEPGRRREKLAPVDEMAEWLVSPIVSDLGLQRGDTVLAFVNGMGGTPLIELYVRLQQRHQDPRRAGHHDRPEPRRELHHEPRDGRVLGHAPAARRRADRLWDAPVHTPALRWGV